MCHGRVGEVVCIYCTALHVSKITRKVATHARRVHLPDPISLNQSVAFFPDLLFGLLLVAHLLKRIFTLLPINVTFLPKDDGSEARESTNKHRLFRESLRRDAILHGDHGGSVQPEREHPEPIDFGGAGGLGVV